MRSYLDSVAQFRSNIFNDFRDLIRKYGQNGHLYVKNVVETYLKKFNVDEYILSQGEIFIISDDNGKQEKEKLSDMSTENMIMMYEITYILLMLTQYNAVGHPEDESDTRVVDDVQNLISGSVGKKVVVDMMESGEIFSACDDIMNNSLWISMFCTNAEQLMDIINEDNKHDEADEFIDEDGNDDFDINDIKGLNINYDGDDMHVDIDDDFGTDFDVDPEYITFEITKNNDGDVCIACYSEDNEKLPHLEIPVQYLPAFDAMYYYDFIRMHETK